MSSTCRPRRLDLVATIQKPRSAEIHSEISAPYGQTHDDLPAAYTAVRDGLLAELESSLIEVREGRLTHYLGLAGLTKRVDHLQSFSL